MTGANVQRRTPDTLAQGERIRPLRDYILVKPLEWKPSEILTVIRYGRPLRGVVKACGPGTKRKIYHRDEKGQKIGFRYSKHFQPTEVKPGDIVELGGLNIFDGLGYQFPEILIDNEPHLMIQEADVAGIMLERSNYDIMTDEFLPQKQA